MRQIDVADVPEGTIRRTCAAMGYAAERHRLLSTLPQIAAAAIVTLAIAGIASLLWRTSTSLAFADVVRGVLASKTVRCVVVDSHNGGTLLISGARMRFEGHDMVVISDSAAGQQIMLDVKGKLAYRIPIGGKGPAVDFYGLFRSLSAARVTPIEERADKAGRRLVGFAGKARVKIGSAQSLDAEVKVWSDPATKLPVRMEVTTAGDNTHQSTAVIDEIEMDIALDDSPFRMSIPADYKLCGLTADQLKPALSAEEAAKLTLVPGAGIGQVKFEMTREQIVAILGEPEFTLYETYLEYPSKGLQLILAGGHASAGTLGMIIANPGDAASRIQNSFPGQTDKGIRIGSTKQQVLGAYGEPDALPPDFDKRIDTAGYNLKHGIGFFFLDGKVSQIILIKK
jgi:hypothetical protein